MRLFIQRCLRSRSPIIKYYDIKVPDTLFHTHKSRFYTASRISGAAASTHDPFDVPNKPLQSTDQMIKSMKEIDILRTVAAESIQSALGTIAFDYFYEDYFKACTNINAALSKWDKFLSSLRPCQQNLAQRTLGFEMTKLLDEMVGLVSKAEKIF